MADAFDPYHKWLGIPPKDQPPDHYRLLGIERFETDLQVIELAADRQMNHLRTFHSGPQSALSQRLLEELAAARLCLLNAQRKAEYDRELQTSLPPLVARPPKAPQQRASRPQHSQSPQAVMATVVPTAEPPPSDTIPLAAIQPAPTAAQPQVQPNPYGAALPSKPPPSLLRGRKSHWDPTTIAATVALIVIGNTILAVLFMQMRPDPTAQREEPRPEPPTTLVRKTIQPKAIQPSLPAPAKSQPLPGSTRPVPSTRPAPSTPPAVANLVPASVAVPADSPTAKFAAARQAMASRDLEAAERELDAARPLCDSVKQQEECSRLEQLLVHLQAFWSAVQEGWNALQEGEELQIVNELFEVVKVDPATLVLRSVNKESSFTRSTLTEDLAVLLASRKLATDAASTYLSLGAFHALDRFGDREQAPVMWNLAANAGSDPALLLPELKKSK